ncbi:hypothetical protein SM73_00723 [Klebsiella quasipneumoniae]|nr:hypothetical protein SM73_00723 [Klebsiella quasipneumoniae]
MANHLLKSITAVLGLACLSVLITSMSFRYAMPITVLVATALLFMLAVSHGKKSSVQRLSY